MMENNGTNLQDALPANPTHVHLLGIAGVGMVGLARLFLTAGARVTGSDQAVYPPMSDLLEQMGIELMEGYGPKNLLSKPDLAVVGNVIRSDNPEAHELTRRSIPYTSMAGALERYFLDGMTRVVVCGTHGKTTLTSMISWILFDQGLDPSFFIGGIANNFGYNSRLGKGGVFVVEGDEYDTAYFDKIPKFLHYSPDIAIVTSIEFDHADIYRDLNQIKSQFESLLRKMPAEATLIACSDYAAVGEVLTSCACETQSYGLADSTEWSIANLCDHASGLSFEILRNGESQCKGTLPVFGVHNALNTLAAISAVSKLGITPEKAMKSMESFSGVQRRQQIYEHPAGVTIIDDFAHHPTAARVTCQAIRSRYPDRRLIAIFEPRTNTSRRSVFQKDYATSFLTADLILLREPPAGKSDQGQEMFDSFRLAEDIRSVGKSAEAFGNAQQILDHLMNVVESGDVVLIMSNGNFEGLRSSLINRLDGGRT